MGATNTYGNPSGEKVYTFKSVVAQYVVFSTCSSADLDTYLWIYDSDWNELAGNDDTSGCDGFTSEVGYEAAPGQTLSVVVEGYGPHEGAYELSVSCEARENTVETDSYYMANLFNSFSGFSSSVSPTQVFCTSIVVGTTSGVNNFGNPSDDVVYRFESNTHQLVVFSTCQQADFNSFLRLYDSGWNQVAFNDDAPGCENQTSWLQYNATAGETLYILVEGHGEWDQGVFELSVCCGTCHDQ